MPDYQDVSRLVESMLDEAGRDERIRYVAEKTVPTLPVEMQHKLAVEYLLTRARGLARSRVERIEREATRPPAPEMHETPGRRPRPGTAAFRRWMEDPTNAASEEKKLQTETRLMVDLMEGIATTIKQYSAAVRMEWTAELLATDFALPTGERVTWGDATLEQHGARVALLSANAAANMEAAARHEKALEALKLTGVATLNDLVSAAA